MWIDLALQQGKFRILFLQIFYKIFPDQSIHSVDHLLVGTIDLNDFVRLSFKGEIFRIRWLYI